MFVFFDILNVFAVQKLSALWIVFEPIFFVVFGTFENYNNAIVKGGKNNEDYWFLNCDPVLFGQGKHRKDWWLSIVFSVHEWERSVVHLFNEFTPFSLLLFEIDYSIFHWLLTWEWDAGERGYIYIWCTFL